MPVTRKRKRITHATHAKQSSVNLVAGRINQTGDSQDQSGYRQTENIQTGDSQADNQADANQPDDVLDNLGDFQTGDSQDDGEKADSLGNPAEGKKVKINKTGNSHPNDNQADELNNLDDSQTGNNQDDGKKVDVLDNFDDSQTVSIQDGGKKAKDNQVDVLNFDDNQVKANQTGNIQADTNQPDDVLNNVDDSQDDGKKADVLGNFDDSQAASQAADNQPDDVLVNLDDSQTVNSQADDSQEKVYQANDSQPDDVLVNLDDSQTGSIQDDGKKADVLDNSDDNPTGNSHADVLDKQASQVKANQTGNSQVDGKKFDVLNNQAERKKARANKTRNSQDDANQPDEVLVNLDDSQTGSIQDDGKKADVLGNPAKGKKVKINKTGNSYANDNQTGNGHFDDNHADVLHNFDDSQVNDNSVKVYQTGDNQPDDLLDNLDDNQVKIHQLRNNIENVVFDRQAKDNQASDTQPGESSRKSDNTKVFAQQAGAEQQDNQTDKLIIKDEDSGIYANQTGSEQANRSDAVTIKTEDNPGVSVNHATDDQPVFTGKTEGHSGMFDNQASDNQFDGKAEDVLLNQAGAEQLDNQSDVLTGKAGGQTGANVFSPVNDAILAQVPQDQKTPAAWHEIYNEVVKMRAMFTAPVDTMGCERMPETITPNIGKTKPHIYRFQLLISLMLSSQTKDEVNFSAMVRLQTEFRARGYQDGLCLPAVLAASESDIDTYISKVGFHKRKAAFIKKTCQLLVDKFGGDIPKTIDDIVTLPGVGPKMGYLLLQQGWKINDGIGVDVHLHRLAQMWHWVPKSDKPEFTRAQLENWLPKSLWSDINPLLVGFGQVVCVPRANNCDICPLATKGLCKSANKKLVNTPMSQQRKDKLLKQRGDLSQLLQNF